MRQQFEARGALVGIDRISYFERLEFWMGGSEGICNGVCFRTRERANRVDQFPCRLNRSGDFIENAALDFREFLYIFGSRGPSRLRIPAPGSGAAARRVDEDAVELRFSGQMVFVSPGCKAVIEQFRPASAPFEIRQAPFSGVTCPDGAFVLHEIAEMKCFATFAGANIPPGLARNRSADMADCLRTEILKFKLAFVKERGSKQVLPALIPQCIRNFARAGLHP